MTVILETERLLLRTWKMSDAPEGFDIWRDPAAMRYIGDGEPMRKLEDAERWIERAIAAQERQGFCRWAAVEKASAKLIGSCGFGYLYDEPSIELGYLFGSRFWGQGYATEAARACLQYGFEQLNLPEIVAVVTPEHLASRRVLEKIGFSYQGLKRYDEDETADAFYLARKPE
jgi:ribosomal-protein-alanine N-acetyltransferase